MSFNIAKTSMLAIPVGWWGWSGWQSQASLKALDIIAHSPNRLFGEVCLLVGKKQKLISGHELYKCHQQTRCMILHCAKSTWGSQQRNHPNSQCEDRQHFSSSRGDFYVSRMLFHWKNLWKCEFLSFKKGTSSMFKPIPDLTISWICLFRSQNHPHKLEILAR